VDDLVDGLIRLMNSDYKKPVNLGNPDEFKVEELALIVKEMIGSQNVIEYKEKVEDDPQRRRPDITVAKEQLNWEPRIKLRQGLEKSIEYFRSELNKMQSSNNTNN
jgi:nucleoside-diphosphate-sugar epimerase